MTARVGDQITTRVVRGEIPQEADLLRTRSGRTYLVIAVKGRRLECVVVPPDTVTEGAVWEWEWAARGHRRDPMSRRRAIRSNDGT